MKAIRNWLLLRALEISIVLVIGPLVVAGCAVGNVWRAIRSSVVAVTERMVKSSKLNKETN